MTAKGNTKSKQRSRLFKALITLIIVLGVFELGAFIAMAVYVSDYEHADSTARAALESTDNVTVNLTEDWVEFTPEGGADAGKPGIIFYPGGKVEYTAYAPLMMDLANEGYYAAVVKMPFNLAMLDSNKAGDVRKAHPETESWIIGGHSLGGVSAAKYAAVSDFDGLFLLASYSTTDLSDKDIPVVSVYGDKDGVLDLKDYEAGKSNLPGSMTELVITGGNHSQFGSYGLQEKDNKAVISAQKQRAQAVRAVLDNIR